MKRLPARSTVPKVFNLIIPVYRDSPKRWSGKRDTLPIWVVKFVNTLKIIFGVDANIQFVNIDFEKLPDNDRDSSVNIKGIGISKNIKTVYGHRGNPNTGQKAFQRFDLLNCTLLMIQ